MKNRKLQIIVGLIFLVCVTDIFAEKVQVGVLKFINKSDYHGNWNLEEGITQLVWEKIATTPEFEPKRISVKDYRRAEKQLPDNLSRMEKIADIGQYFGLQYIIGGEITDFDITNFGLINPKLAGYSSYSAKTQIDYFIVDTESWQNFVSTSASSGKVKERDIATIFTDGGSWGKGLSSMEEFNALKNMKFGSGQWRETKVGESVLSAVEQVRKRLKEIVVTKSEQEDKK